MQFPMGKDRLDLDTVLARVGGDKELLRELLKVFAEDAPLKLAALDKALATGDLNQVSRSAHSIKGAAGAVGAEQARSLALDLETAGRDEDAETVARVAPLLVQEIEAVTEAIRQM